MGGHKPKTPRSGSGRGFPGGWAPPAEVERTAKRAELARENRAAAARENGKKGGRPVGGFRSSDPAAYAEHFDGLRERVYAIDDPLARIEVALGAILEAVILTTEGRGNRDLNAELRAFAATINKMIPRFRLLLAERRIREAATPTKARSRVASKPTKRLQNKKPLRG